MHQSTGVRRKLILWIWEPGDWLFLIDITDSFATHLFKSIFFAWNAVKFTIYWSEYSDCNLVTLRNITSRKSAKHYQQYCFSLSLLLKGRKLYNWSTFQFEQKIKLMKMKLQEFQLYSQRLQKGNDNQTLQRIKVPLFATSGDTSN